MFGRNEEPEASEFVRMSSNISATIGVQVRPYQRQQTAIFPSDNSSSEEAGSKTGEGEQEGEAEMED